MTKRYYRPANRNHMRKQPNILAPLAMIIASFLMLYAASGKACDDLYIGALSYHVNDDRDLKSAHALLACEKSGYIFGAMENSFGEPTAILGKQYTFYRSGYFEAKVAVGISYGYYGCKSDNAGRNPTVCPMVVPEISYTKHRVKPTLAIINNAIALTAKVGF